MPKCLVRMNSKSRHWAMNSRSPSCVCVDKSCWNVKRVKVKTAFVSNNIIFTRTRVCSFWTNYITGVIIQDFLNVMPYAWQRNMYLLKIDFSRITPAILTDPDKILRAYVGRTQISGVKILTPWAKGAQNGGEKGACFCNCNGYNELSFLCNRIDRHEIRAKNVNRCALLNLEELRKFPLRGLFCSQTAILGLLWQVSVSQGLRVWATVCKTVHHVLSDRCCLSCLSVTLVYCGQTVGWIKMPHGTEVGHGPGDIVVDGVQGKGAQQPPLFGPCLFNCSKTAIHLSNCWALTEKGQRCAHP